MMMVVPAAFRDDLPRPVKLPISTPPVYILLLNYGKAEHTLACLDSLRGLDYPDYRILVIDNASPDDSVTRLQARLETHPDEFRLLVSPGNLGFSGGNNLGIRHVLETEKRDDACVWLLNNDATVDPQALSALMVEVRTTGGLAGSCIRHPDGRYQQVGTHFRWWTGGSRGYPESEVHDGMPVETLCGASMLIPLRAFRQAGLLDESFFLYFEDGEFSLRCARFGFPLTVAAGSAVYHEEGATTGRKSLATQYYFHRNRMRLLLRCAHPVQKPVIAFYSLFRLLRAMGRALLSRRDERKKAARVQALAFGDLWKGVSGPCPHRLNI